MVRPLIPQVSCPCEHPRVIELPGNLTAPNPPKWPVLVGTRLTGGPCVTILTDLSGQLHSDRGSVSGPPDLQVLVQLLAVGELGLHRLRKRARRVRGWCEDSGRGFGQSAIQTEQFLVCPI